MSQRVVGDLRALSSVLSSCKSRPSAGDDQPSCLADSRILSTSFTPAVTSGVSYSGIATSVLTDGSSTQSSPSIYHLTPCFTDAAAQRYVLFCKLPKSSSPSPRRTLFDSGASHIVHPTDHGAIPGTWQAANKGLYLGNDSYMPVVGTVEKDLIVPPSIGGPDIRRRVLIAPTVCTNVHSASREVDQYGSTIIDSPTKRIWRLKDGREIPLHVTPNCLRWVVNLQIRPTASVSSRITAGAPVVLALSSVPMACFPIVSPSDVDPGVGKSSPQYQLTSLEWLRLWHARLGHVSARVLLLTLRNATIGKINITKDALKQFIREHCDLCNAYRMKHKAVSIRPHRSQDARFQQPSTTRALRPLRRVIIDIFGKVRWPSAQQGFIYLLGIVDECTGMRWVFGTKTHSEAEIEMIIQRFRVTVRLTHGEIEIIRSDNAAEFARAADWFAYLVDSGIVGEYSVAYEHHQVGAVERGWGIILAIARTLLAQAGFSMSHWYSACVHGCTLAGFVTSDVVNVDGDRLANSAFYRFWRYEPDLRLLRCYGSPMRYYLDPTQRDHKLGLTGEAGYYVGISPENHQAIWVWNGSRYLTVSGSCVIDETRFLEPLAAHATHLPHWPNPAPTDPARIPTPRVLPTAKHALPLQDALPNGFRIKCKYWTYDATTWHWHEATVVGNARASTGRMHHLVRWKDKVSGNDKQEQYLDLKGATTSWLPIDNIRSFAPSTPTSPTSLLPRDASTHTDESPVRDQLPESSSLAPAPSSHSGGASVTSSSLNPEPPSDVAASRSGGAPESDALPDLYRIVPSDDNNSRRFHLLARAHHETTAGRLTLAAAITEAADVAHCGDFEYDPDDILRHQKTHGMTQHAALHSMECISGRQKFDELNIHELQQAHGVYVFGSDLGGHDDDPDDTHPALLAAKSGRGTVGRRTVVYYTDTGVARVIEPKSVKDALNSLQADQWIMAIDAEVANLRSHSAYHLVPRSEPLQKGKRILRLTFVFKVKVKADMTLEKFKARLCVVGSSMQQGTDFWESYSATARTTSIKLIIISTVASQWIDFHFDLYGAFLTAGIDTDVYTDQPPGLPPEVGPNGEAMVWKLDKAIYGTVQAARLFAIKLRTALLDIGFERCIDDPSVYRLDHKLGRIILGTHVDDGIGGASTQAVLDWFYQNLLSRDFQFSADPGPWTTLLGFGVKRDHARHTVTLSARKYIETMYHDHMADDAKACNVPTPALPDVATFQPPPAETDAQAAAAEPMRKLCRALIGSLLYIAQIHPGIVEAVARLCAFMAKPTVEVYRAAKRVLTWLWHRKDLGVTYGGPDITCLEDLIPPDAAPIAPMSPRRGPHLTCCVDSDLSKATMPAATVSEATANPADRNSSRSQLGYEISIAHGCLEAVSRRQVSVAVDAAAAEVFAASTAAASLITVVGTLRFVSFGILGTTPVPLWCDNEACIMVSKDATSLKRLSYITRRVRLLQELAAHGVVVLHKVPGTANPADALTKVLALKYAFKEYMAKLYNVGIHML